MDGETTEIDQDVFSGSVGDISVSLVAPDTEGTYIGYWKMADSDGNVFGQWVYVMIVVSDDGRYCASVIIPSYSCLKFSMSLSNCVRPISFKERKVVNYVKL